MNPARPQLGGFLFPGEQQRKATRYTAGEHTGMESAAQHVLLCIALICVFDCVTFFLNLMVQFVTFTQQAISVQDHSATSSGSHVMAAFAALLEGASRGGHLRSLEIARHWHLRSSLTTRVAAIGVPLAATAVHIAAIRSKKPARSPTPRDEGRRLGTTS